MIDARISYRPGQRLEARDLDDDAATERAQRAAHVRALHRACGVACGLEVALAADGRGVTVSPGLAYDGAGEELLLPSAAMLRTPAWAPEGPGKAFEAGIEIHRAPGQPRARVRWTLALDPAYLACGARARRFLLAVFALDGAGRVTEGPRFGKRMVVRTDRRPAIATGELAWAQLAWHTIGTLQWADVDTSAANFPATPVYFVRFSSEPEPTMAAGLQLSIQDPTPRGFRLNAVYFAGDWRFKVLFQSYRQEAKVEWTAVEALQTCLADPTQGDS